MTLSLVSAAGTSRDIAVIGSGISGVAAAWLLSNKYRVTVYEKDDRMGGHAKTIEVPGASKEAAVDTGFIAYDERNSPNLVALLNHLDVQTHLTDMTFAASLDDGRFEYSGSNMGGLLAQPRNAVRPRMWMLLRDLQRFYRNVPKAVDLPQTQKMTLGDYLRQENYSSTFVHDHLLPVGAAIWSAQTNQMLDYPLSIFVRFFLTHGLFPIYGRPVWRTVLGGSRQYLNRLTDTHRYRVLLNRAVRSVRRLTDRVLVEDRQGEVQRYDHVVIATHADQALAMLADPDGAERRLLGRFRYERNLTLLHSDEGLMPHRRRAWASRNFMSRGQGEEQKVSVTYWMNRLQQLPTDQQLFVSLNPLRQPAQGKILRSYLYEHPVFDRETIGAQRLLWNLQGVRRTWYCGAYFGHGFHEDGLQAGLAVAEQLGNLSRPWKLTDPNSHIHCNSLNAGKGNRERAA